MHYSQAGGGGPQGVARRAGSAAAGLQGAHRPRVRRRGACAPRGPRPELAAVRHALQVWQVNTVVIATDPSRAHRAAGAGPDLRGRLHDGRPGSAAQPSRPGPGCGTTSSWGSPAP